MWRRPLLNLGSDGDDEGIKMMRLDLIALAVPAGVTMMDVPPRPLLHVQNLCVGYGDVQVLWDVSFDIQPGEIVALVGSNGAGKTTLLWTLSGLLKPRSGQICFDGKMLEKVDTQKIVDLGVAHVPEGRKLFGAMSVLDNLKMGAYRRTDKNAVSTDLVRVLDMFPR